LHGVFDQAKAIDALALWCDVSLEKSQDLDVIQEQAIEKLADVCQQHIDLTKLEQILQQWRNS
jgi:adenosylcobyric acid synthase